MFEGSSFKGDLSMWSLHADCNMKGMMYSTKKHSAPLLRVDSIDDYQKNLDSMYGEKQWSKKIPKNPSRVTAHHLVLLLLLPDQSPKMIHRNLTLEDTQQLHMLYQLTGSVYQSVNVWVQQRNNTKNPDNTTIAAALDN